MAALSLPSLFRAFPLLPFVSGLEPVTYPGSKLIEKGRWIMMLPGKGCLMLKLNGALQVTVFWDQHEMSVKGPEPDAEKLPVFHPANGSYEPECERTEPLPGVFALAFKLAYMMLGISDEYKVGDETLKSCKAIHARYRQLILADTVQGAPAPAPAPAPTPTPAPTGVEKLCAWAEDNCPSVAGQLRTLMDLIKDKDAKDPAAVTDQCALELRDVLAQVIATAHDMATADGSLNQRPAYRMPPYKKMRPTV